jgi:hypothetical protein
MQEGRAGFSLHGRLPNDGAQLVKKVRGFLQAVVKGGVVFSHDL